MALPVVNIEGRIAADPQLRFAPSGTPVLNLRVVSASRKKEGDNWVDDKTLWIDVTAFNKLAENVAESLKKGDLVIVHGKLQTEEWEKDGQKHSKIACVAESIGPSLMFRTASLHEGSSGGGSRSSSSSDQSTSTTSTTQSDEPPF